MNLLKQMAFQTISVVLVLLLSLSNSSNAKCVQIPPELTIQCKGDECLNGIVWKSDENNAKYHPKIEWTSGSEDSRSSQFEVIAVDQTGKQVPWPYPLGQGLYLSMTGSFAVSSSSSQVKFDISDPTFMAGYSPLATLSTASPVAHQIFTFDSSQNSYQLYIVNLGGEDYGAQTIQAPPRIWLTVRAVGPDHGEYKLQNQNAKDGLVCSSGSISITSPCQFEVNPTSITFDDMRASGSANHLAQVKHSNVTVTCGDQNNHKVFLRVTPAERNSSNERWANFKHADHSPFKGLALTYKLNERPQTCEDGDVWNQELQFGEAKNGTTYESPIYWGLCRTSNPTDVGDYSTTAIIYFWVD